MEKNWPEISGERTINFALWALCPLWLILLFPGNFPIYTTSDDVIGF